MTGTTGMVAPVILYPDNINPMKKKHLSLILDFLYHMAKTYNSPM